MPEDALATRDEILFHCLDGEELINTSKRIAYKEIMKEIDKLIALSGFLMIGSPPHDPYIPIALDAAEKLVNILVTDANYLQLNRTLYIIYFDRAKYVLTLGKQDVAVDCIKTLMEYADKADVVRCSDSVFTSPLVDGHICKASICEANEKTAYINRLRAWVKDKVFDPIRDRDDFKALFG